MYDDRWTRKKKMLKRRRRRRWKPKKKGKKERIENRCAINTTSVEVRWCSRHLQQLVWKWRSLAAWASPGTEIASDRQRAEFNPILCKLQQQIYIDYYPPILQTALNRLGMGMAMANHTLDSRCHSGNSVQGGRMAPAHSASGVPSPVG